MPPKQLGSGETTAPCADSGFSRCPMGVRRVGNWRQNMPSNLSWAMGALIASGAAMSPAMALPVQFDLLGKAGSGLLAGNENVAVVGTPGSGGEVGAGISLDQSGPNPLLTINIGWGIGQGFTNLTGNASAGHIHGPTAATSPLTGSFLQNAGVMLGLSSLSGWTANASNGGFSGTVQLTGTQKDALLDGRLYINVHTGTNGGGEIRGNLVMAAVPEPATYGLMALGLVLVAGLARRRRLG